MQRMKRSEWSRPALIVLAALAWPGAAACPQQEEPSPPCRLVFWNVENFFDPFADSLSAYTEYNPGGEKHWSWRRYEQKRNGLAKTLLLLEGPPLVGLAEVENAWVLRQLAEDTPLSRYGYEVLHREGPDRRGIDVALLYRPAYFSPLACAGYTLPPPWERSREILYVKGLWQEADTLHLFVNHWPSKRGGAKASQPGRMAAARILDHLADSILAASPRSRLVAMGDFNDGPQAPPLRALARWRKPLSRDSPTYKYRGRWDCIDQLLLRGAWAGKERAEAGGFPHLLERDDAFGGTRPRPTYTGPQYKGGVSDHLPVLLWWE